MHHLFYAGTRFTTTDDLAEAAHACGVALSTVHRSEAVDVPVVYDSGATIVRLMFGPGVPVAVAPCAEPFAELPGESNALARMRTLAANLLAVHPL